MQNTLYIIEIYRHAGTWCFTDLDRGLVHEPFVLGIPEFIDTILKIYDLETEEQNYRVIFSQNSFPTHQGFLSFDSPDHEGAWYSMTVLADNKKLDETSQGWLCPATLKFFETFPNSIYFKLEPIEA